MSSGAAAMPNTHAMPLGGFSLGEKLYWIGVSEPDRGSRDRLVHGALGEVIGPAPDHADRVCVLFPGGRRPISPDLAPICPDHAAISPDHAEISPDHAAISPPDPRPAVSPRHLPP